VELSIKHNDTKAHYCAALDIGSNSFHFVLARIVAEHLQIVHREKYKVKLAAGLNNDMLLNDEAIMRGIATLASLCSSTEQLSPRNFRVVATHTLRQAKNTDAFLLAAKQVFPFDLEIISGHEEARLIYVGVNQHLQSENQRLVIDIGGGSTECIIGQQQNIKTLSSLQMGCVSYTNSYFGSGDIDKASFTRAHMAALLEMEPIIKRFNNAGWTDVIGTSGTIKTIFQIVNQSEHINKPITYQQLLALRAQLISFKRIENIKILALKDSRRQVICGGVAILIALMTTFEINEIDFCKYALREGVLYEQFNCQQHDNIRSQSIESLATRFNADQAQNQRVQTLVTHFFKQTLKSPWKLTKPIYQELLNASVQLHEIGLDINPSGYHKHGQYILSNADIAGFNQEQQQALAWLVGNQRKSLANLVDSQWHILKAKKLMKLAMLIRLGVILSQQRSNQYSQLPNICIDKETVTIQLPKGWLLARPIIKAELALEATTLSKQAINLVVTTI
jgi:exopolyphosphatase/guanosine-5'-triphosphate,3'-diphosphate pyrophosphatase